MKRLLLFLFLAIIFIKSPAQNANLKAAALLLDTIAVELANNVNYYPKLILNFVGDYSVFKNSFYEKFYSNLKSEAKKDSALNYCIVEFSLKNISTKYYANKNYLFYPSKLIRHVSIEADALVIVANDTTKKYFLFVKNYRDDISESDLFLIEDSNFSFTKGILLKEGFFAVYGDSLAAILTALTTAIMFFLIRG